VSGASETNGSPDLAVAKAKLQMLLGENN